MTLKPRSVSISQCGTDKTARVGALQVFRRDKPVYTQGTPEFHFSTAALSEEANTSPSAKQVSLLPQVWGKTCVKIRRAGGGQSLTLLPTGVGCTSYESHFLSYCEEAPKPS